jgi:hypothetical protein
VAHPDQLPECMVPDGDIPNEIGQKGKLHRQTSRSCIAVYVVSGISTRVLHTLGHTIRGSSSARSVLDPHPAGLWV